MRKSARTQIPPFFDNDPNTAIILHLQPYFVYASCEGSGESAHMRRLA